MRLLRDDGAAHDPRHRRRRAGREGPRLGEPQAVEARAAARVLHAARVTVSAAQRHAQDLRADRAPFRLGDAADAGVGARDRSPICSIARCARRASSASIRSATSTRRAKPAMPELIEARVRRKELVPVAIEGAARGSTGRGPRRSTRARRPPARPVHILSPFDPLVIQRKRLKLFFDYDHRLRGLCAEGEARASATSRCRCWSATNRRRCSTSRPTARRGSCSCSSGPGSTTRERRRAQAPRSRKHCSRFERFQLGD